MHCNIITVGICLGLHAIPLVNKITKMHPTCQPVILVCVLVDSVGGWWDSSVRKRMNRLQDIWGRTQYYGEHRIKC